MNRRQQRNEAMLDALEAEDLQATPLEKLPNELRERDNQIDQEVHESLEDWDTFYWNECYGRDRDLVWSTDGCVHGVAYDESCEACWEEEQAVLGLRVQHLDRDDNDA